MLSNEDLIGSWRLISHYYLDDDGTRTAGPLGDHADGLLIYHEDGHMAASMMRTEPDTGSGATYLGSADDYLGYSGRWQLRDGMIAHQVSIGSHQRVVNTEQLREVALTDGCLSLRRHLGEPHSFVVMDWRRA